MPTPINHPVPAARDGRRSAPARTAAPFRADRRAAPTGPGIRPAHLGRVVDTMSKHTKVNLKDVEDHAPKFGLSPGLEFRTAREALGCEQAGFSYQRIAPDFRQPFGHSHKEQEEIYVLVSGGARVKLDD